MTICPFWSTSEEKVKCSSDCPFYSCEDNGGICPFIEIECKGGSKHKILTELDFLEYNDLCGVGDYIKKKFKKRYTMEEYDGKNISIG